MSFTDVIVALKIDEGANMVLGRHQAYRCPSGRWSIGYGHNLEAHGIPADLVAPLLSGKGITCIQADQLLYADATQAQRDAAGLIPNWITLDDVRQDVVTNMSFNMGRMTLSTFHDFLSAVNRKDFSDASAEMLDSVWAMQTGNRAKRLAKEMLTGKVA